MSAQYLTGIKTTVRRTRMSSSRSILQGFDYRLQKQVQRSKSEWRNELQKVIAAGGRRRVEDGETFAHGDRGIIQFEIYGNVSL